MKSYQDAIEWATRISIDTGNVNMRKAGRIRWSAEDRDTARAAVDKIAYLIPGWTEENPLDCRPRKEP